MRITAQLIDAAQRTSHVWAERYDRDLSDIFALQDEISQAIVAALKIKLLPDEKKAIEARSTRRSRSLRALSSGAASLLEISPRDLEIAIRFCQRALEIDPNYARAWALLAVCQERLRMRGRIGRNGSAGRRKGTRAGSDPGRGSCRQGPILETRPLRRGSRRARGIAPPGARIPLTYSLLLAWTCFQLGRHEAAIEHCERAAQLLEDGLSRAVSCDNELMRRSAGMRNASLLHVEHCSVSKGRSRRVPTMRHAVALGCDTLAQLGEKERAKQWASARAGQSSRTTGCALQPWVRLCPK